MPIKKGRKAGKRARPTEMTQQMVEEARAMYMADRSLSLPAIAAAMDINVSNLLLASSKEKALTGLGWSEVRKSHYRKMDEKFGHLLDDPEVDSTTANKADVIKRIDDLLGAVSKKKLKEFADELGLDQYRALLDLKNRVSSTNKLPKQTVIVIGAKGDSDGGFSTDVTVIDNGVKSRID